MRLKDAYSGSVIKTGVRISGGEGRDSCRGHLKAFAVTRRRLFFREREWRRGLETVTEIEHFSLRGHAVVMAPQPNCVLIQLNMTQLSGDRTKA